MWAGSVNSIPPGWVICDGNNGTPDLRDRFLVGAGSAYVVGDTGGEDEHTLVANEIPVHSHNYTIRGGVAAPIASGLANIWGGTSTQNTTNTGGDQAHENRPPYLALAYIMKV